MRIRLLALVAAVAGGPAAAADVVPAADHHQHLFSPAIAELFSTPERKFEALTAQDLIAHLDAAGIRRAAVLSVAYMWGRPDRPVEHEYDKVRAENDWTAGEAARYPDRLVAFCSVNPLKDYALDEVARCAKDRRLRHGLKLHFGNSDVQVDDPAHAAQLRRVFAAAGERGMAIAVHMRASISKKRPYGAGQARIFLEQLLPAAGRVPVQVAHLAGTGPGYDDPPAHEAMAVLVDAVARGDRRTRNLWFDVASNAGGGNTPERMASLAATIRKAGVRRILYGTDAALEGNTPRKGWEDFRKVGLTAKELATIAGNRAPYLR